MRFHYHSKQRERGFTLFELMIAIAIIAILTSIGMPSYKKYIQKAALVDMLQLVSIYKTAIELCVLEQGSPTTCHHQTIGMPINPVSRYVASSNVESGIITLVGSSSLLGLTVTINPLVKHDNNELIWQQSCHTFPKNITLEDACNSLFKH